MLMFDMQLKMSKILTHLKDANNLHMYRRDTLHDGIYSLSLFGQASSF